MENEKSLMQYLEDINTCKVEIKAAIEEKGGEGYLDGTSFSGYAGKIRSLQTTGDAPTPTPSAEYIYSNGFLTGGTRKDIANLEAYKIELDSDNTCEFRLTCAKEFTIWTGEDYDIVFTVEVPEAYTITKCVWLNEANNDEEMPQDLKPNPRYTSINRNGIAYNSFVRVVEGDDMMNDTGLNISDVKYIITIKKI